VMMIMMMSVTMPTYPHYHQHQQGPSPDLQGLELARRKVAAHGIVTNREGQRPPVRRQQLTHAQLARERGGRRVSSGE
jgi:hypothetical protein